MNTDNPNSTPDSRFASIHQRLFAIAATALLLPVIRAIPDLIFAFMLGSPPLIQLFFCAVTIALCTLLYRLHRVALFPACLIPAYSTYGHLSSLRHVNRGNAAYYYVATETVINVALIGILLYVWFATRPNTRNAS